MSARLQKGNGSIPAGRVQQDGGLLFADRAAAADSPVAENEKNL
jgi:hypothetical protein